MSIFELKHRPTPVCLDWHGVHASIGGAVIYAQEKKAVSQPLWFAPATEEQLTPTSLADLRRFIRTTAQRRPSRDAPRSLQARLTGCTPPPAGALAEMSTETCAQERHTGVRRARPLFTATPAGFQNNGLKFHWAVAHTVERYRSPRWQLARTAAPREATLNTMGAA